MNILFVSQNFPPEVNALANRVYHNARLWADAGHGVEVLTDVPCYPEGEIYEGYRNASSRETVDGVDVLRVPLLPFENRGVMRRLALYISFGLSATWHRRKLRRVPDIVIGTSPHLFNALAGYAISRRYGAPFVLEIRDLWPDSVVASGLLSERSVLVRGARWVVDQLYERCDHLVVVTEAIGDRLVRDHDVSSERISVVRNGADLDIFEASLDPDRLEELRTQLDLDGKFVASYLGTVGAAHRADVLFEAARHCEDPDLIFMVVGAGPRWDELADRQDREQLPNFRLVEKQPRDRIPYFLELSDASVVHLRDSPLFETALPSKVFEAMATGTPILLGVRGESREVVCREAECGVFIEPEDSNALLSAVRRLRDDPAARNRMSANGRRAARERFNREALAVKYLGILRNVAGEIA